MVSQGMKYRNTQSQNTRPYVWTRKPSVVLT
jgi:hypothetical protein